jgi:peptidoglycan L-alanyl-D-glutamate endopeptidase CwlK
MIRGFKLSARDLTRLSGVHPDLVRVVERAAAQAPLLFIVIEGVRTPKRQSELLALGKTQTLRSRHLRESNECGMSCAVDLAIWEDRDADRVVDADELSWKFPYYKTLAATVKSAATELGVHIEWGGDWATLKDGPHFQLPWFVYP